jgi:hypothetical protein
MPYTKTVIDDFSGGSINTSLWFTHETNSGDLVQTSGYVSAFYSNNYTELSMKASGFNLSTGILAVKLGATGSANSNSNVIAHFAVCNVTDVGSNFNNIGAAMVQTVNTWSWYNQGSVGQSGATVLSSGTGTGLSDGNWLGFGMTGTTLYFYKSTDDGATWTELGHTTPSSFTSTNASLRLFVEYSSGTTPTLHQLFYEVAKFIPTTTTPSKLRVAGAWKSVSQARTKARVSGAWHTCTPKVRTGGVWKTFG